MLSKIVMKEGNWNFKFEANIVWNEVSNSIKSISGS